MPLLKTAFFLFIFNLIIVCLYSWSMLTYHRRCCSSMSSTAMNVREHDYFVVSGETNFRFSKQHDPALWYTAAQAFLRLHQASFGLLGSVCTLWYHNTSILECFIQWMNGTTGIRSAAILHALRWLNESLIRTAAMSTFRRIGLALKSKSALRTVHIIASSQVWESAAFRPFGLNQKTVPVFSPEFGDCWCCFSQHLC